MSVITNNLFIAFLIVIQSLRYLKHQLPKQNDKNKIYFTYIGDRVVHFQVDIWHIVPH